MSDSQKGWLLDPSSNTARYVDDKGNVATFSGFSAGIFADSAAVSAAVSFDGTTFSLGASWFNGLSSGSAIHLDTNENWYLGVASGLNTEAKLVGEDLSFGSSVLSDGSLSVLGTISSYYEGSGGKAITYHAAENKTIATVTGLSSNAALSFAETGNIAKQTIQLDPTDFKSGTSVGLSLADIAGIDLYGYGLSFQLVSDSTSSATAVSSIGFGALSAKWVTSGTSATYYGNTAQGWTLSDDAQHVLNTGATSRALVNISGFSNGTWSSVDNYGSLKLGSMSAVTTNDAYSATVFTIYEAALGTNSAVDLVLTDLADELGREYSLSFASTSSSILGMTAGAPSWKPDTNGTSATYKFSTSAGWILSGDSLSISYKSAHDTPLASISGISANNIIGSISTTSSAITDGTSYTLTVENVNVFGLPTGTAGAISVAWLNDLDPNDKITFNWALSNTIAVSAAVKNLNSSASVNTTTGEALIQGTLSSYHVLNGMSITSYEESANYTLATITGLSTTANISLSTSLEDAGASIITLDKDDLTTQNVSISRADIWNAPEYYFSLSGASVATEKEQINFGISATVSLNENEDVVNVHRTAHEWYDLASDSKSITYNAPEDKVVANITGLNIDNLSFSGPNQNISVSGTSTSIIQLEASALGDNDIKIVSLSVGGTKAHGLSLALMGTSGISTVIGLDDSASYWGISSGKATYQYHVNKGWTWKADSLIKFTAQGDAKARFSIDGLRTDIADLAASVGNSSISVASFSAIAGGGSYVVIDTNYLDTAKAGGVILDKDKSAGKDYTFSLQEREGDTDHNDTDTKVGFDKSDYYWKVTKDGDFYKATYNYNISDGWELNRSTGKITYTGISTFEIAQITGLTGNDLQSLVDTTATAGSVASIAGISVSSALRAGGGSEFTFTVSSEVLGASSIAITKGSSSSATVADIYKLGLSLTDSESSANFKDSGNFWTVVNSSVSNGSASYQHYIHQGWKLDDTSTTINYSASTNGAPSVWFTVTGLSGLAAVSKDTETAEISAISVSGTTITIDTNYLNKDLPKNLNMEDAGKNAGYTFNLKHIDDHDTDNKVGFDNSGYYWKVTYDNTSSTYTAIFEYDIAEGWEIVGDSVVYTSLSHFNLASISGLHNLASISAATAGSASGVTDIAGISYTVKDGAFAFTLSTAVLGASNVSLTKLNGASSTDTFSLALEGSNKVKQFMGGLSFVGFDNYDGAVKEDSSTRYWSTAGQSATYKFDRAEGWKLDNESSITYTGASTFVLASISGLQAFDTKERLESVTGISAGITTAAGNKATYSFTLDADLLADRDVSLSSTGDLSTAIALSSTTSYALSIDGASTVGNLNVYGFENHDAATNTEGKRYWTTDAGASVATYGYSRAKGWTILEGGSGITYTGASTFELAKIEGLSTVIGASATLNEINGITVDIAKKGNTTAYTFNLDKSVLGYEDLKVTASSNSAAKDLAGKDANNSYAFALNDASVVSDFMSGAKFVGFENYDGATNTEGARYWSVSGTSATYKFDRAKGWTLNAGNSTITYTGLSTFELASISGLSNLAASTAVATVDGITVTPLSTGRTATTYTFELSNPVLGSSDISLSAASLSGVDNKYKLALKDSFTAPKDDSFKDVGLGGSTVAGFGNYDGATNQDSKRYWTVKGTSEATYSYSRAEGWALDAGASKVTYTGLSSFDLAHLTGLSSTSAAILGIDLNHLNPTVGSGSVAGTIELPGSVLNVTGYSSVALSSGDNYNLTLANGLNIIGTSAPTMYLDLKDISKGNVLVKETLEGGWLGDSSGKQFTYYAEIAGKSYATVSGLNTNATSANIELGTGGNSTIIYVSNAALSQGAASIANIDGGRGYSLALQGGGTSFGFGNATNVWGISGASLVYYLKTDEGWSIDGGGTSGTQISYTKERDTYTLQAAIANLSISGSKLGDVVVYEGDATVAGISVSTKGKGSEKKTVFTLSEEVLSKDSAKTVELVGGDTSYSLALEGGGSTIGFGKSDYYWKVTGTSAYYEIDTYEGWTLLDSGAISYAALSTATLAHIDGLSFVGTTSMAVIDGISVTRSSLAGGSSVFTFSIANSLLEANGTSTTIKVIDDDDNDKIGFKLALTDDAEDGKVDGKVGFEASDEYWKVYEPGSVSYMQDFGYGWALSSSSSQIIYGESSTVTFAQITGLSNIVEAVLTSATYDSITGIAITTSVTGGGSTAINFSIGDDLLGESAIALSGVNDIDHENNFNKQIKTNVYSLALTSDIDKDGKIGFATLPNALKPDTNTGTTAIYYSHTEQGWSLSGMSILFTSEGSTHTTLAKITNLAAGLSAELLNGKTADNGEVIPGYILISADNKVLTINSMSAFDSGATSTASIEMGNGIPTNTYSLSIASHLNTQASLVNSAVSAIISIQEGGNSAIIKGAILDYVELAADKKSVKHTTAILDQGFATITGLGTGASAGTSASAGINVIFKPNTGDDEEYDPTITLYTGALSSTNGVSLALQTGLSGLYDYKLALGDDVVTKYAFNGISTITDLRSNTTNGTSTAVILGSYSTYYLLDPDKKGITYSGASNIALAEIKGLSNNVTAEDITVAGASITLGKGALSAYTIELIDRDAKGDDHDYYLALASDATGLSATDPFWTVDKGVATYGFSTGEGWSIVDGKVVYSAPKVTTYAIITGLSSGTDAAGISNIIDVGGNSTNGFTFMFKSLSAFSDDNLTLTNDFTDGKSKFAFNITGGDSTKAGFVGGTSSLTVAKGSATWSQVIGEGWTIGEDGKTINHAGSTTQVLASVNGLGNGARYTDDNTTDVDTVTFDVATNTFSISTAALTSSNVEVVNGEGISTAYKLALAEDNGNSLKGDYTAANDRKVGFEDKGNHWTIVSKGVADYSKFTGEGWTLAENGKTISYTEAKENASDDVIVQITNLNKNLTTEQFKNYVVGDVGTPTATTKGSISLAAGALGTGSKTGDTVAAIAIGIGIGSDSYALALNSDVVKDVNTTNYWTVKGTTATYKQNTSAFYSVSGESDAITYNKATTGTTLATITNLKSPKATTVGERPAAIEGIAVVKEPKYNTDGSLTSKGEILIVSESIISTTSKQTAIEGDYTIKLGDTVSQEKDKDTKDLQWTVDSSKGKATLNNVSKAYYSTDGTSITYNEGSATEKLATLSGLKKTVTAAELKKMISTAPTTDSDGKVTTKGTITLTTDALNKTNVTITSDAYELALDNSVDKTSTTLGTWSISGTTLTIKGTVKEGYRLNTDGSISYLKGQNNTTLLTIKNLPSGLTLNANGKIDGITVNQDTGKVTFDETFLAKYAGKFTKITISGTGYSLDDFTSHENTNTIYTYKDSAITGKTADGTEVTGGKGIDALRYSGSTATYKRVIPAYFKISGNTLSYVKEADYTYKENKQTKKLTYATVTGLTKGLTLDGDTLKSGDTAVFTLVNSDSTKTITLKAGALGSNTIELKGSGGYSLVLDDTDKEKLEQKDNSYLWSISGTTATLYTGKSAGWDTSSSTKFTKKAATSVKNGTKLATVKGLKSGLKVTNAAGQGSTVAGLEVDDKTIKVGDAALAKTTVTINSEGTDTYTLALADGTSKPDDGYIWSVSGSTLTIKTAATTSAGYTINDKGQIVYTKAGKAGTQTVAKVEGLKKGLKIGANGKVDGIVFDSGSKTFTLSKKVLGTTSVTASTGYTITTSSDVVEPTSLPVWSVSGTKATLKVANTAGYKLSSDGKKLTYTKASNGSVVATVDGIKKGIKPVTVNKTTKENTIDGLKADIDGKTITVDSNVLNKTNISVSGNGGYKLVAGTSVPESKVAGAADNTNTAWTISGTTATLKQAASEGYTISSDGKKLEYVNGKTGTGDAIVSVKGLKSGLKVENGEIAGLALISSTTGTTITLDSRVLGSSTVSVSDNTYKLALDTSGTKNTPVDGTAGYSCKVSGTTVTLTPLTRKGYVLNSADNTISASTPSSSSTTFATITGLKSGLKADSSGQISGITFDIDESTKLTTITLDESVLGTTDVKVTPAKSDNKVILALADSALTADKAEVKGYPQDKGIFITTTTTKGYTLVTDANDNVTALEYVAPSTVTTTIEGLNGTPTFGVVGTATPSGSVTVNPSNNTITIDQTIIGDKVTMSGGDYKLAVNSNTEAPTWQVHGTTATLVQTASSQNQFTCDGTTITRNSGTTAVNKVLATLTGLPEGVKGIEEILESATITEEDGVRTITLPASLLNQTTSTIKLTGDGYQLALDTKGINNKSGSNTEYEDYDWTPHKTTEAVWSVSGTTATFATGTTAGFTLSKDGKTATYSAFKKDKNAAKATVTGLASGVLASDIAANYKSGTLTLTIAKKIDSTTDTSKPNMLGETDVKATGCKVKLDTGVPQEKTDGTAKHWVIDNGNAIYCDSYKNYYTATSNAVTYHSVDTKGNIKTTYATIAGLSNPTVDEDGNLNGVTVDPTKKIFEVAKAAIGTTTSDIKLTIPSGGDPYKLTLAGDVTEPEKTGSVWSVSGTSATLKDNYSVGYSVSSDGKTISYSSKLTTKDLATLTGLASGLKVTDGAIEGIAVDNKTITVSGTVLASVGTASLKSADKTNAYTLKLDRDSVVDDTDEEVRKTTNVWKYDSATKTSTYKTVIPAHYELISDKNSIKYVAESVGSGLATITGVKSNIEDEMFDADSKTVTLTAGNLGDTDVSIKSDSGYTLALDDGIAAPSVKSSTIGTDKVTGARSSGYTVSDDGTKVIFAKATSGETFAAITGMTGKLSSNSDCVNTDSEMVYLDGSMLKDEGVAVSGSFTIDFANYDDHSINGSTGADKVAVNSGMTVSLGGGDDYVKFNGEGNIFVYNSGDGNDVIADFTASGSEYDQIEIKGAPTISVSMSGGDVVIDITKGSGKSSVHGSITLENCSANQIFINGKATAVSGAADLLYDENNLITEDAQLDELTGNAFNAYSLEDIDAGTQGLTKLNKQNSLVTYGSNDSSKK